MWETTSSVMRVAVLVLVTSTFAAAWNHDQQTQAAFVIAKRSSWRQEPAAGLVESSRADSIHSEQAHPAGRGSSRHVSIEMEVPEDIGPGRYRVVDPTGMMVNISLPDDGVHRFSENRDLYYLDVPAVGKRYFIRLAPPTSQSGNCDMTASASVSARR